MAAPAPAPAPGEALQRVCPHCSTLAFTAATRCPWCGHGYTRRLWPALLAVGLLQTAILLVGLAVLLSSLGDRVDERIATEVDGVERQVDAQFDRVREDVRAELDARLPDLTP